MAVKRSKPTSRYYSYLRWTQLLIEATPQKSRIRTLCSTSGCLSTRVMVV